MKINEVAAAAEDRHHWGILRAANPSYGGRHWTTTTAKDTSLREYRSFEPFCMKIDWDLAFRTGRKKSETHARLTWEWGVAINTGHELPFSACDVFVDILYVYLATNNKKLYAGLLMRQLRVVITTAGMATTCNLMLSPALPFIWLLMNYSLWLR